MTINYHLTTSQLPVISMEPPQKFLISGNLVMEVIDANYR
jgi:hypothetical protein